MRVRGWKMRNELFGCKNHHLIFFFGGKIAHAYYYYIFMMMMEEKRRGRKNAFHWGYFERFHIDDNHKLAHSHR